jgi:hypothetical protein
MNVIKHYISEIRALVRRMYFYFENGEIAVPERTIRVVLQQLLY